MLEDPVASRAQGHPRRSAVCTVGNCCQLPTYPHPAVFCPRHNYIEGTKMLAAYLYEVSQLKN